MCKSLLGSDFDLSTTIYCTARVASDDPGFARQSVYLDALRAAEPALQFRWGKFMVWPESCPNCGVQYQRRHEKQSDVNLAVELLLNSARAAADLLLIVSGDSDLVPAARGARQLHPSVTLAVGCLPNRQSQELLHCASSRRWRLSIQRELHLLPSLLPDSLSGQSGHVLVRPPSWS